LTEGKKENALTVLGLVFTGVHSRTRRQEGETETRRTVEPGHLYPNLIGRNLRLGLLRERIDESARLSSAWVEVAPIFHDERRRDPGRRLGTEQRHVPLESKCGLAVRVEDVFGGIAPVAAR
jgi:hypothetical protein